MVDRFGQIPQFLDRGEPMDAEGRVFFTEVITRLAGSSTTKQGVAKKMPFIADASGWSDATAQSDFNDLLGALRTAGLMEES